MPGPKRKQSACEQVDLLQLGGQLTLRGWGGSWYALQPMSFGTPFPQIGNRCAASARSRHDRHLHEQCGRRQKRLHGARQRGAAGSQASHTAFMASEVLNLLERYQADRLGPSPAAADALAWRYLQEQPTA